MPNHQPSSLPHWLALQHIGLGYQTLRTLQSHFGTVEAVWRASATALAAAKASPALISALEERRRDVSPEQLFTAYALPGVTILTCDDPQYPTPLRETHSPPLVLFCRGNLAPFQATCCTVVGTRTPSAYGLAATRRLTEPLAAQRVTIVSGLAFGIDAEAHRAAIRAHGRTVAVLGNAIDAVYPTTNRDLAESILAGGGAIISEYPPGTPTQRHFFPQRNRILAGLSRATIVVEAGATSGALITARMALDENRDVFAVPGPIDAPTSAGTNDLLKAGAAPLTSPGDLGPSLGLSSLSPKIVPDETSLSPTERQLLKLLSGPRHVDELAAMSTLDTSVVSATLSLLELKGNVRHLGGMRFDRIR